MNHDQEVKGVGLAHIFGVLLRGWWAIIIITAVCAGTALIYNTLTFVPRYTATTQVLIKVGGTEESSEQITASSVKAAQELVPTLSTILKSDKVLDTVVDNISYDYTRNQIASMISVSAVEDTAVMKISVTCSDAVQAAVIANSVREYGLFGPEMSSFCGEGTVITLSEAQTPTSQTNSPNRNLPLLMAVTGGFVTAAALILIDLLNTKVKTENDLKGAVGVPVLGIIPNLFSDEDRFRYEEGGRQK